MFKKISIISLLSILSLSTVFAYNINDLENLYNKKLDKLEQSIELKYKQISKICYYKKERYNALDKILNTYKTKHKKYENIFDILIKTNTYRYDEVIEQCNKKEQNIENGEQINDLEKNNITVEKSGNIPATITTTRNKELLTSNLEDIEYDYNGNISFNTPSYAIKLPKISKIQDIYNNFIVKVNNNWIGFKKILTIKVHKDKLQDGINYARKKYDKEYIFYKKIEDEYKIWIIEDKNIDIIAPFNPTKSINYNINKFKEAGYIYIENFFYSQTDKNNIITSGLFKYEDKLYYMSLISSGQYYEIPKNDFIKHITNIEKGTIIISYEDKIIAWKSGIKNFYLGKFETYKNIDLYKLGKLLNFTFYTIGKHNLEYSVQNMYNLLNFTKQFEGKTLEESYKRITSNMTYNETVNNILNEEGISQKILNNKINTDKELIKNWNVFKSLESKEGVCQSISDIFSLIGLFNGKQADTIVGMSDRGYLHQVSKIGNYYYDPTYDLDNKKEMKYYKMNKQKLEKYFNIVEK